MNDDDNGIRRFFIFFNSAMYKDSNILNLKRVADVLFLCFTHMLVVTNMSVFITNLILFINYYFGAAAYYQQSLGNIFIFAASNM